MEPYKGDDSVGKDEEAAVSLLVHRRLIISLAWRRRLGVAGRASGRHPGPSPGKKGNKKREFLEAERRIRRQYFGLGGRPPTYDDTDVQRRFRMPRSLFLRIYNDVEDKPWWVQRPNATGHMQAHSLQELLAALHVLSYGDAEDRNDDSVELSKTTVHNAVMRLISFILEKYEPFYLRAPTMADLKRIMERNA